MPKVVIAVFLVLAVFILPSQQHGFDTLERLSFSPNGTILLPNGEEFRAGGWSWGHWTLTQDGDGDLNAAEGASIVRIILRWWGLYGDPTIDSYADGADGHFNFTNIQQLDNLIDSAVKAKLWINLAFDSNCGQNGAQDPDTEVYCTINGQPAQNFFNNLGMRTKFKEAWTYLANRYKNTNRLAWYEIMPEPGPPGFTDADVKDFYADMIPVLRAVDSNTPILIGANNGYFANKIATVYDAAYTNVVYTANFLAPVMLNTTKMQSKVDFLTSFRDTTGAPVFVQQVGITISQDPSGTLLADGLQLLINNHIGFTGWEYRGPTYPEYSVWYQNKTSWVLKPLPYDIYKSKFAQWNSPLETSAEPSTAPSLGKSPTSDPIPTAPPSAAPSKGVKSSAYCSLPHVLLVLVVAL
eukprot:TRINITY_DN7787_c0_g1_i1.p1 TRINITY_DN7787_c0_g1~~TRINITY_DN7787_c0_g1_i1.p1  ORF type:complete len:410 (-),score=79.03 TRINITY_DN7787_c0_g1_i1:31-1260(-)